MTVININSSKSFADTVLDWCRVTHPQYPTHEWHVWEETINPSQCVAYRDLYNVVFFLDVEWNCLRVVGMARYGDWNVKWPFPPPFTDRKLVPRTMPLVKMKPGVGECTLDHAKQRIRWIMSQQTSLEPLFEPDLELTSRMLVGWIPMESHPTFEEQRVRRERNTFVHVVQCSARDDEPTWQLMECATVVEPTEIDLKTHWDEYAYDPMPKTWWSVPASDVSADLMACLPLYPGYVVHINWRHLPDYLWNQYMTRERAMKTRIWKHRGPHQSQLVHLGEFITSLMNNSPSDNKELQMDIADVEDLVLAPCTASLLNLQRGRFPRDQERQMAVRILHGAKVPLSVVEKRLNDLNERYPHETGALDTKKRWDYESHYKKGYAAPNCDAMSAYCPFQGQSTAAKKIQCHRQFRETHPNFYRAGDEERFYNPASWIYWGYRGRK